MHCSIVIISKSDNDHLDGTTCYRYMSNCDHFTLQNCGFSHINPPKLMGFPILKNGNPDMFPGISCFCHLKKVAETAKMRTGSRRRCTSTLRCDLEIDMIKLHHESPKPTFSMY